MGRCRKFCCCLCCPCCFLFGTLQAFLLLGAAVALVLALAFGPAQLDLHDDVADICEAAAWFMDTKLSHTIATSENMDAWAKVCRDAFADLDPEAQELLRSLQKTGQHRNVTSLFDENIDGRSDGWRERVVDGWVNLTAKEELPEFVPLDEIPRAFQEGKVLRFDGTQLLPPDMFNATLAQIEGLHQDTSNTTHVYGTFDLKGSICRILMLLPLSKLYPRMGRTMLFSVMRMFLVNTQEHVCKFKPLSYYFHDAEKLHSLGPGNVNLRRLPHFDGGLNVSGKIGLGDNSPRGLSLLWYGQTPLDPFRSFHTDVQDNVLIELVSPTVVHVVPREVFWGKPNGLNYTAEYHKIRLEPGQGVAIPSNFLHSVDHLEADRLAVNYFFEPRFGTMQWPGTTGNYYTEAAKENKGHLAMRSLWFSSVGLLWDRFKIGMTMHSWKMEVL